MAAAVPSTSELAGTWYGSLGQIAASLYADEGTLAVHINPDGTYTGKVTPSAAANNRAKPATWSGTVVTEGDRGTLRNARGPWPWVTLTRSDNGTLYGVATDPAIGAPVMLKLQRDGGGG